MEIKVAAFEIKLLVKGKGCSGPDRVKILRLQIDHLDQCQCTSSGRLVKSLS